uniref:Uncharacterized protein n=1 Tax=Aegilops tauschii TaxID=37682 RepID=M8BZU0_AEGTA
MAWCCPCTRQICTGDLVALAPDWVGSETVTSARDSSWWLSRFGEVGWQPSSQAPVVAHTGCRVDVLGTDPGENLVFSRWSEPVMLKSLGVVAFMKM